MSDKHLLVEQRGGVLILTFNRPEAMNAMSAEMSAAYQREWARVNEDPSIRVLVMTGAGDRAFSAGADLQARSFAGPRPLPDLNYAQHWSARLLGIRKPTIAAVNGVAAGGGFAIAVGCDIRVASDKARFTTSFARIGMPVMDSVAWILPKLVGLDKALELIYTAAVIDAREAKEIGLVTYVVPPEQLMERTLELAERIAAGPPLAQQLSKYTVYSGLDKSYAEALAHQTLGVVINSAYAQHDIAEGGRAFRERRPPQFRGLAAEEPGS
jgi:2-(1,2-epoxy-1,2-dihydrophenyl)acetyl-CoA isomerase